MKKLSKSTRLHVLWNHQFLQGSWNYERMQNGGWCYGIIPALDQLYDSKDDKAQALKRHLAFYNTHPYVSAPIIGVALALEEKKANGEPIEDQHINDVKVAMMGPLASIGDPIFWFTLRPILASIGAFFALSGNLLGPLFFFGAWNIIRLLFLWIMQEKGYEYGETFIDSFDDTLLHNISLGASVAAMFIFGALVNRFVTINFNSALLQTNLDAFIPNLSGLLLTLLCCYLLKKKVSPLVLIVVILVIMCILSMAGVLA